VSHKSSTNGAHDQVQRAVHPHSAGPPHVASHLIVDVGGSTVGLGPSEYRRLPGVALQVAQPVHVLAEQIQLVEVIARDRRNPVKPDRGVKGWIMLRASTHLTTDRLGGHAFEAGDQHPKGVQFVRTCEVAKRARVEDEHRRCHD
jgi:hypothetical protein